MSFPFLEDLHALHSDPLCSTSGVGWTLWDISASPVLTGYVLTVCSSARSALYGRLGMLFFIFVVLQKCPGLQENWRFTLAQALWYLSETYVPTVSPVARFVLSTSSGPDDCEGSCSILLRFPWHADSLCRLWVMYKQLNYFGPNQMPSTHCCPSSPRAKYHP